LDLFVLLEAWATLGFQRNSAEKSKEKNVDSVRESLR